MTSPFNKIAIATLAALALSACNEETKSENIDTKGIWAGINVTANGKKSNVSVELNVSGPTGNDVSLSSGDKLEVKAGNVTKTLTRNNTILNIDYEASVDLSAGGTEFTVSLTRANKTDAPNSKVKLPEDFNILLPLSEQSIRFSDPISVAWTPARTGKVIEITFESVCKNSSDADVNLKKTVTVIDNGTYIHNHASDAFTSIDKTKGCTTKVTLSRKENGTFDSNFVNNSFIRGYQNRTVEKIKLIN